MNSIIPALYLGRIGTGLIGCAGGGGGEATRGGVARNWTEMELSDFGTALLLSDATNPPTAATAAAVDSPLPSTRMGIILSLGLVDVDATLTAMLISAFWIGLASTITIAFSGISPGPLEKRLFNGGIAAGAGCSLVGLRMPRMKAFSDPAIQSSSVLSVEVIDDA
jgi:hypothetical protein